jgi:hypothetical protein
MENLCYYVNSYGLLKSCDFHSPNPKSSCNNDFNYLIDMIKSNKMFDNMSIYVCSDLLLFFIINILPKIKHNFVLVTGDSDINVPKEILTENQFNLLINSTYLLKWLAQNTQIQNNIKIIQLPIGLDFHTISNNPNHQWKLPNENHLPKFQEKILQEIKNNSKPFYERINKIYVNFTTSKSNDRFNDRINSLRSISPNLLVMNLTFTPRTINWNTTTKYTFVLSPFGNGMDCHRTWEALCLGSIPIIKAPNFKALFEDLPVLIVNNWSEVTEDLLNITIINFKSKLFNYEKLTLEYWKSIIKINNL